MEYKTSRAFEWLKKLVTDDSGKSELISLGFDEFSAKRNNG